MPDVTASKMHACERATLMRYKHLRCKSCEIYASIPSLVVLHKLASRRASSNNVIKRAPVAMDSQAPKRQAKKPNLFSQSPSFVALDSQVSEIPEVHRPQN